MRATFTCENSVCQSPSEHVWQDTVTRIFVYPHQAAVVRMDIFSTVMQDLTLLSSCRYPPFYADDRMQLYQSILAGKIEYPRHMKKEARDLIGKLLTADLSRRLGNLKGGGRDIRMHPWFKGFDWESLLQRTMPAPISINARSEDDTSMFDDYDDEDGPDVGAGKVGPDAIPLL